MSRPLPHRGQAGPSTLPTKPKTSSSPSRELPPLDFGRMRREEEITPGLSAICVVGADDRALYSYVSESVTEILGYRPHELIGRSCYELFQPDEIPQTKEVHYRALADEQSACVAIMHLRHKQGHFVECVVAYSTVYDKSLTMISRTDNGTRGFQNALTARDVFEISPASHGRYNVKRTSQSSSPSAKTPSPPTTASPTLPPFENLPSGPQRTPRTFFLIDRFTDTARVMFVSNDLIVNGQSLNDHTFYSIIKPSDRPLVQRYIEEVKRSSPVVSARGDGGGHGYTRFSVLKIPDLPPISSRWPEGTDESERIMPGQEFIPVEGIFTACSDGVTCVIARMRTKEERWS